MSKKEVPIHHPRHEPAGIDEINDIDIGNTGTLLSAHKSRHVITGLDPFVAGDLLDATGRITIRKNSGAMDVGTRRRLNLMEGANVTLTVLDDAANEEVDVMITAAGGGVGLDTSQFFPATNPNTNIGAYPSILMADGISTTIRQSFMVPHDIVAITQASLIIVTSTTGSMRWGVTTNYARLCASEDYNTHTDAISATDTVCTINKITCLDITEGITGALAKDSIGIEFTRYGGHVNDTVNASVHFLGIYIEGELISPPPPPPVEVNATIVLTSSFDGGGVTYWHGAGLGDYPLFRLAGAGVTLSNVIVDDKNLGYSYAAVVIGGNNNRIEHCTLINCVRYGFTVQNATNFYIGYNTVLKAQYGISGSSGGGVSGWGVNGVIEYNNISGIRNCGIKCKAFDTVIIRYNYIDLTPTFSATPSKLGIHISSDAPNLHLNIINNNIIRVSDGSYPTTYAYGLDSDSPPNIADPLIITTDNHFTYNNITNCRWGIYLNGDNMEAIHNTIVSSTFPITDSGSGNVTAPNP